MKKKILIAIAVCYISATDNCCAQVRMGMGFGMRIPIGSNRMPPSPEQRTEREVQKLKQDLGLHREQTKQVRTLFQQRDIARRNNDSAALKNLRIKERLQEILTPEQYGKFLAMKQSRKNPPPASPPPSTEEEKKNPPPAKAVEPDDVYQ